ncbi:hypothetical protein FDP56_17110 [Enterococcus casseliflavus]|uniref:hypothetical protein n=1 Tax=Enterococcus casseliflavus TaxID=37734 RepID=UPI00129C5B3A|nr:hypothetical protein [Enterococcus casseliflavus]MRI72103.1 hypothetical protein [Enterococcus casseliflavus]
MNIKENNKVEVCLDNQQFTMKPTDKEDAPKISKRIGRQVVEITMGELSQELTKGRSMTCATFKNNERGKANLSKIEVLALDFDNKQLEHYFSIEDALKNNFLCENASFLYQTFSSTKENERFRVVFRLSCPIYTNEEYEFIYQKLIKMYPSLDTATKDTSRIFYGGRDLIMIDENNILDVAEMLKDFDYELMEKKKEQKLKDAKKYREIDTSKENDYLSKLEHDWASSLFKNIKNGYYNIEETKNKAPKFNQIFANRASAAMYFEKIYMPGFLGLPEYIAFNSIYRFDEKPSATIFEDEVSGIWLYHDFGTGDTFNLIGIVQRLLPPDITNTGRRIVSRKKALEYLLEITGCKIEMIDSLKEVHEFVEELKMLLLNPTLKEQEPEVYQLFARYNYGNSVCSLLDIFKNNIYEDDEGNLSCFSWNSIDTLAKSLNTSRDNISRRLKLMTLSGIIDCLDDTELPSKLLEMLESGQENYINEHGHKIKRKNKKKYRSNVHMISENNTIENFIEKCKLLVDNDYSTGGLSKEWVERVLGKK